MGSSYVCGRETVADVLVLFIRMSYLRLCCVWVFATLTCGSQHEIAAWKFLCRFQAQLTRPRACCHGALRDPGPPVPRTVPAYVHPAAVALYKAEVVEYR